MWAVYIEDINVNQFSPLMQEALARVLASMISQGVGERQASPFLMSVAEESISNAWLSDCHQHYSGENYPDFVPPIDLIRARYVGGGRGGDSDPRYLPIVNQ